MLSKRLLPSFFRRTASTASRFTDRTKLPKLCSVDEAFAPQIFDKRVKEAIRNSSSPSATYETLTHPPRLESAFDDIIDVRTQSEYLEDHIPGATNLPVLDESQRSLVGKLHNKDAFEGHKTGAAFISAQIANILERQFADKGPDHSVLLYCWRGGLRSHSLALVLANVGFDVAVLEGGHKKYRERVRSDLASIPGSLRFRVISGPTGSGKSHILRCLQSQGAPVLDLELLAKHKGSVLGRYPNEGQPKQKLFESLLWRDLRRFASSSSSSPIWVESESKRIGDVSLPESLFDAMKIAPRFDLTVPLRERVKRTIDDYPYFIQDPAKLKTSLSPLSPKVVSVLRMQRWMDMIEAGNWEELVESLLVDHYDPSYANSQAKNSLGCLCRRTVEVESLDTDFVNTDVIPRLLKLSDSISDVVDSSIGLSDSISDEVDSLEMKN